jgi:hypothetical protein
MEIRKILTTNNNNSYSMKNNNKIYLSAYFALTFKNRSCLTLFELKRVRRSLKIFLPLENILSQGTEVPRQQQNVFTNLLR